MELFILVCRRFLSSMFRSTAWSTWTRNATQCHERIEIDIIIIIIIFILWKHRRHGIHEIWSTSETTTTTTGDISKNRMLNSARRDEARCKCVNCDCDLVDSSSWKHASWILKPSAISCREKASISIQFAKSLSFSVAICEQSLILFVLLLHFEQRNQVAGGKCIRQTVAIPTDQGDGQEHIKIVFIVLHNALTQCTLKASYEPFERNVRFVYVLSKNPMANGRRAAE